MKLADFVLQKRIEDTYNLAWCEMKKLFFALRI